eukprot:1408895-Amphidinium_carterae.1
MLMLRPRVLQRSHSLARALAICLMRCLATSTCGHTPALQSSLTVPSRSFQNALNRNWWALTQTVVE